MYRVRDFAEERSRTLYVRLPHRIRDPKEVQGLFNGDAKVKLPRQASRACHVIFPSVEEKVKGLKDVRNKTVDGKRVMAKNPRTEPQKDRVTRKKIVVPVPKKSTPKITQSLYVSNLNGKTSIEDLKKAFPGSSKIAMLEVNSNGLRSAFVKMESIERAGEYLRKEKPLPVIKGNKIFVNVDKRSRTKPRSGSKSKKIKVYDQEGKATKNKFENLKSKKKNNSDDDDDDDDDDEEEDDEENGEGESKSDNDTETE